MGLESLIPVVVVLEVEVSKVESSLQSLYLTRQHRPTQSTFLLLRGPVQHCTKIVLDLPHSAALFAINRE